MSAAFGCIEPLRPGSRVRQQTVRSDLKFANYFAEAFSYRFAHRRPPGLAWSQGSPFAAAADIPGRYVGMMPRSDRECAVDPDPKEQE